MSQLFSERWPSTPAGRGFSGPTTERNIDFELDVRVEIDSGKCVLHPTTQQPEHEDISLRRCDSLYSDNSCWERQYSMSHSNFLLWIMLRVKLCSILWNQHSFAGLNFVLCESTECSFRFQAMEMTWLLSLWVLQELWAQPQESGPGISPQKEEAAAHLHLHHPSPSGQEMSLVPADQIQWHGDHSLLYSRSRC